MTGFWARYGKRAFDLLLAFAIVILLWPVLATVALLVRIKLGPRVLFSQQRLGKDAVEFRMYKFRSMTDQRNSDGQLLPDDVRLTRFGNFLRSTSLDELPQIINIVKGEMSFIGPRATLPDYKSLILERYPKRFKVPQGITSLPGVRGRNALSCAQKYSMDVEYVERFGFLMDMEIFFRTIPVILGRKGISMDGVATATRYDDVAKDQDKR